MTTSDLAEPVARPGASRSCGTPARWPIVGASPNPARASNFVATYLLASTDYDVYFVNPNAPEILGRPVYPTLAELPVVPDLVDVFRRRDDLPAVLDEVLALPPGVRTLWLQFGLFDEDVARRAEAAGLAGGDGPLPQGRARPLPRRPAPGRLRHRRDQLPAPGALSRPHAAARPPRARRRRQTRRDGQHQQPERPAPSAPCPPPAGQCREQRGQRQAGAEPRRRHQLQRPARPAARCTAAQTAAAASTRG